MKAASKICSVLLMGMVRLLTNMRQTLQASLHPQLLSSYCILIKTSLSATMYLNAAAMNLMDDQTRSKTCDDFLKFSIPYFLGEYPQSVLSLSNSKTLYRELIVNLTDLPLEFVWFYGAVKFHKDVVFHSDSPQRLPSVGILLAANNLLEFMNGCTCLCGVLRKVAVIAPVIFNLYQLEVNFSASNPPLREEIGIAVEGIVSYISSCCSQYLDEGGLRLEILGAYILDLMKIWMVHVYPVRDYDKISILARFFPSLRN